jgi:acetyltransferase-like isoleucine patch superfamily enzyme
MKPNRITTPSAAARKVASAARRRAFPKLWKASLRSSGVSIGRDVAVVGRPIVSMERDSEIVIGDRTALVSTSHGTALGVSHPVILRTLASGASIVIGLDCGLSGTSICSTRRITIGDRVLVGADVVITDTDFHAVDVVPRRYEPIPPGGIQDEVVIEDDVFIGGRSVILKGVRIGKGSVIGAGSIVTTDIPAGVIAAGNPCRVTRELRLTP